METGSVGVEGRRRRSAAGMTADSLRLWEGDEDEEGV